MDYQHIKILTQHLSLGIFKLKNRTKKKGEKNNSNNNNNKKNQRERC